MSADSKGLQINVMGREFRVACPEDEQKGLLEAVDYLNRKMNEIRDAGKVIGLERIAIMAALNIAHELMQQKQRVDSDAGTLAQHLQTLRSKLDGALAASVK